MAKKATYFVITKFPKGGIVNTKETLITQIDVATTDEEFSDGDFSDFEEYATYVVNEECAGNEQHFGECVVLTEAELKIVSDYEVN